MIDDDEPVVTANVAGLVAALRHMRGTDLAELQRLALSGMRAGLDVGDVGFAGVWQAIGRCVRAERGRREQAVIDFADELDGPPEGALAADGGLIPPGWVVDFDEGEDGYDGR